MGHVSGQWVQMNDLQDHAVNCVAVSGKQIFCGTRAKGVFRSTDEGMTWTAVNTGLTNLNVKALACSGSNVFAGIYDWMLAVGGIFLSSNGGTSWTQIADMHLILSLAASPTSVFAGTDFDGIDRSTDTGRSWISVVPDSIVTAFAVSGTDVYAGGSRGVYRSVDDGVHWTPVSAGLGNAWVTSLAISPAGIIAGTFGHGLFFSTDNGSLWNAVVPGSDSHGITALAVSDARVFVASSITGVIVTNSDCTRWSASNEGLPLKDIGVTSFGVSDSNLFIGTYSKGIWRRPLSEILVSVQGSPHDIPSNLTLHENYPNPFSSSTTISFTIPSRSFVSLKIFDDLGKEVSTLVSGDLEMGRHAFAWNAGGLRSGVYLCRMQAGSSFATRKLSLLQ
jgi:hypothetical protein